MDSAALVAEKWAEFKRVKKRESERKRNSARRNESEVRVLEIQKRLLLFFIHMYEILITFSVLYLIAVRCTTLSFQRNEKYF